MRMNGSISAETADLAGLRGGAEPNKVQFETWLILHLT